MGKSTTIRELQLWNLCNFSSLSNSKLLLLPTTGMSSACPRTANHLGSCTSCITGTLTTRTGATGETLLSAEQEDHGNRTLHRKTTTYKELRLLKSTVFCTAKRNIPSGPFVMPSIWGLKTTKEYSARCIATRKTSLRSLTHKHVSTVEPSIALKCEGNSSKRHRRLTPHVSTVKPRSVEFGNHSWSHLPENPQSYAPKATPNTVK